MSGKHRVQPYPHPSSDVNVHAKWWYQQYFGAVYYARTFVGRHRAEY